LRRVYTRERPAQIEDETIAADVERIDVSNARTETVQGRALLVCGYEDHAK
jgi:hypothetical protein